MHIETLCAQIDKQSIHKGFIHIIKTGTMHKRNNCDFADLGFQNAASTIRPQFTKCSMEPLTSIYKMQQELLASRN